MLYQSLLVLAGIRVLEKLYIIIKTPAEKIIKQSEAEMILSEMGENEKLLNKNQELA